MNCEETVMMYSNSCGVTIVYEDIIIETDLKIDLLINDYVVVELKDVEEILALHEAQLLTYTKILKKPQGLLTNFFISSITKSFKPFVNEYFKALDV